MLYVLSIYDSAAKYFREPFVVANKGVALREFSDACNDPKTFLNKHPGDYTMFCLGTFEESTGIFNLEATPIRLGLALEFVEKKPAIAEPNPGFSKEDAN